MAKFEDSLKRLEAIVARLEQGSLGLEESLKLFEEGMTISTSCKQELDTAENRVQVLIRQRDGSQKPEPFFTEDQPSER